MNILTFDVGQSCGWAFKSRDNQTRESGVEVFKTKRGESLGMKMIRFQKWLNRQLAWYLPNLVVYEMAHFRGGYATELLVGMTIAIQKTCAEEEIEYHGVHSGKLKKFATGKGNAPKELMVSLALEKYKMNLKDDNEADALHLLAYAEENFA